MRKCLYCGELIAEGASKCRFCNQDLAHPAGQRVIASGLDGATAPVSPMSMTMDDLANLLHAWGQSYANWPDALRERTLSAVDPITREWLVVVVEQWIRHRVGSQEEIEQLVAQLSVYCIQWATLSSAIGIEAGMGHIPDDDVPYYLAACKLPLLVRLVGYLDWLLERNWIKEKRCTELARMLDSYLTDRSVLLANWGHIMHGEMQPKYRPGEASPLSVQLRRLDLTEIRLHRGLG